jgi:hypothetical protein
VVLTHKRDCGGDQFEAPSAVILTEQPVWRDILSDARGVLFAHLFETRPFCDGEARDKSKAAPHCPQCAASTSTSASTSSTTSTSTSVLAGTSATGSTSTGEPVRKSEVQGS